MNTVILNFVWELDMSCVLLTWLGEQTPPPCLKINLAFLPSLTGKEKLIKSRQNKGTKWGFFMRFGVPQNQFIKSSPKA